MDTTGDIERISVDEWHEFLERLADGDCQTNEKPPMPTTPSHLLERLRNFIPAEYGAENPDVPLYSSTCVTRETARQIRDFFCTHGYLPPPRAIMETQRESCILEYDIFSETQLNNIQEATSLIANFFPGTLCSFSLFHNRIQRYYAFAGPQEHIDLFAMTKGMRIPAEDSLCGHAVLQSKEPFFMADAAQDWRYVNNPFVRKGIHAYIGSPVSLDIDPADSSSNRRQVSIGTLNVCWINETKESISPTEYQVVAYITKLLQTQIRATWEGHRRTREARLRKTVLEFLDLTFEADREIASTRKPTTKTLPIDASNSTSFATLATTAVKMIQGTLSELQYVALIDIRSIMTKNGVRALFEPNLASPHELPAFATSDTTVPLPQASDVSHFLNRDDMPDSFTAESKSGLEAFLPPRTESHTAMTFSIAGSPFLLFLASNEHSHLPWEADVTQFIRSICSILRAKSISDRVKEADAIKTAFLSSISHELRTPMHGVMMGLEVLGRALVAGDQEDIKLSLAATESSGYTLQTILNDVLDFGKWTRMMDDESPSSPVNLVEIATRGMMTCSAHYSSMGFYPEIKLEYADHDWTFPVVEARFHRVLINGLSNAIKYSKDRPVVIRLSLQAEEKQIVLEITDIGDGIPAQSLEKLFKPFVKNDDSVPGAGLGLHISRQLVERMSGSLDLDSEVGRGTTFRVLLPCGVHPPVSQNGLIKCDIVTPPAPGGSRLPTISTTTSEASQASGKAYESEVSLTPELSTHSSSEEEATPSGSKLYTPGQTRPKELSPTHSSTMSSMTPHDVQRDKTSLAGETYQSLMRVLIVDDNEICRKLLRAGLRRSPIPSIVLEAANGKEAVQVYKEKRPDLVITDISMPVMDGVTAAGLMREADLIFTEPSPGSLAVESENTNFASRQTSPARIYALTGLGSSDPRLTATALTGFAGLDGWLIKGKANMDAINQIMTDMDREQKELFEIFAAKSLTKKRHSSDAIYDPVRKLSIMKS